MLNKLINKQLFEIKQDYKLNYSRSSSYFKLEDEKDSITVIFITNGIYVLVINVNDNIEYLDKLFDVQILYLLYILKDKLKSHSFSNALKEMYRAYKKIQEIKKELKSDENSTN